MDFILRTDALPISNKACNNRRPQGYQYYQWAYKQKLQKQDQQAYHLSQLLNTINQQESKKQNSLNSVSNRNKHHEGSFYDYNLKWQNKVQKKVQQDKDMMLKIQAEHQNTLLNLRKTGFSHNQNSLFLANHKGPIQAWDERFEAYLKVKSQGMNVYDENATFQPKINQRSKKMIEGQYGKVEDRLIRYGQIVKKKHQQQQLQTSNFCSKVYPQNYSSGSSDKSQFFYRLYKQGQLANKRKKKKQQNSKYSFQPKLNKIDQQMESRMLMNRKPLYYIKNSLSISSLQSQNTFAHESMSTKKGDFKSFMLRNQALIDLKSTMAIAFEKQKLEKDMLEQSKCTFSPVLNKKSRILVQNNQYLHQEHQQKQRIIIQKHDHIDDDLKIVPDTDRVVINGQQISKLSINRQPSFQESDSLSSYYLNSINPNDNIKTKRVQIINVQQSSQLSNQNSNSKSTHQYLSREYYQKNPVQEQLFEDEQYDNYQVRQKINKKNKYLKHVIKNVSTTQGELTSSRPMQSIHKNNRVESEASNIEDDSIQIQIKRDRKWQTQLLQIQSHIENMMSRG